MVRPSLYKETVAAYFYAIIVGTSTVLSQLQFDEHGTTVAFCKNLFLGESASQVELFSVAAQLWNTC